MALIRTLTMPLLTGGIIVGAAVPALASPMIPMPTASRLLTSNAQFPVLARQAPVPTAPVVVVRAAHPYTPGVANRYTVLIRDRGTEPADVPVTLALPASARFYHADGGGVERDGRIAWIADVRPMRQTVLHADAVAGVPGHRVHAVDATACVLRTTTMEQVCGTDLVPVDRPVPGLEDRSFHQAWRPHPREQGQRHDWRNRRDHDASWNNRWR